MIISAMPGGSGSAESRPHELITQEEYNRKLANGEINEETIYLIDDQESIDLSNKADLVDGKVSIDQIPNLEYAPKYNADTAYPTDAYCVHRGALWVNTSGGTVTGVEPGTDYNKWNVTYSNDNLLLNPDLNIWQRYTDKTFTGVPYNTYLADGFKVTSSDGSVLNTIESARDGKGIRNISGPDCVVWQPLENVYMLKGRTVTYSQLRNGQIVSETFVVSSSADVNFLSDEPSMQWLRWLRAGDEIAYYKLELGPFSTLANDTAPDYGTELAKCQRYCVVVGGDEAYHQIGIGQAVNNSWLECVVPVPVTMRSMPVITYTGAIIARNGTTYQTITGVFLDNKGDGCLNLHFDGAFETGRPYSVYCERNAKIILSADL